MVEQRRSHRLRVAVPVRVKRKGADGEGAPGQARDMSIGGMFVETAAPLQFGAEAIVNLTLPGYKDDLVFPAVVRWTREDGMGLQFGLLGARETHAITELVRKGTDPK